MHNSLLSTDRLRRSLPTHPLVVKQSFAKKIPSAKGFHILRYRDDYSVFTKVQRATGIVRIISDRLRTVEMQLGAANISATMNIIEDAITPEKISLIKLNNINSKESKNVQNKILRLHYFARICPNTGTILRLADNLFQKVLNSTNAPNDLHVQVAVVCDIATVSPRAFPVLLGILVQRAHGSLLSKDRVSGPKPYAQGGTDKTRIIWVFPGQGKGCGSALKQGPAPSKFVPFILVILRPTQPITQKPVPHPQSGSAP